ncbi:bifunctional metallophosphatase/5'-nucleotidase [Flavisolibacter nicotianae]|uniref:bifunctional metallophosphatase/5'-nucleotidase n=1 Tax=Flavisolibacter nicotianae TaxID=2364882 RepID=UPI000EB31821|nr:bifunctional metallophosphatase/5'-nucleotidase [Flavisolibacter nicotianae]
MKSFSTLFTVVLLFTLSACKTTQPNGKGKDDHKLTMTFLQINDVYEIAPLSGGREGGIARVATLKKQYRQQNSNTFLVIAGDFLSPSVYNSLQYQGKAVRGRQMVDALNTAGLDIAMFGNHEFDIREAELQDRINESRFQWISTNSFHKTGNGTAPFVKNGTGAFPTTRILQLTDADGTKARIGLLAVTLPFNKADYVSYTDPLQAAKEAYNRLKDSVDAVVAITHQSMEEDERLARELPGLAAIIGGHEHDGRFARIGKLPITKALANAKNAYVVTLQVNTKKKKHNVKTSLVALNETMPLDSATNDVVQKWNRIAEENYSSLGFDAKAVVISKGEPLEGRETEVRSHSTNLTRLIVAAMKEAVPQADVVVLNGGSIRVDDVVQLPVSQYDILRSLPFGGAISEADLKGSLVIRLLEAGRANKGIGGFLHYNENLQFDQNTNAWLLNGKAIDAGKIYHVAMPEFLLSGKEANMDFLQPKNPDVVKVYPAASGKTDPRTDVRLALVQYLQKNSSRFLNP